MTGDDLNRSANERASDHSAHAQRVIALRAPAEPAEEPDA